MVNRPMGPRLPMPARPDVPAMTPKEIFGMLRRHILLIVSLTILGLAIGAASWYLLLNYAPKYTAQTFIKVLPPTLKDPMVIAGAQTGKDIQYGYRLSMAALITQQSMLQRLIERDKVQATKWFESFDKIRAKRIVKAVKNLRKKSFRATAERDAEFVSVSMTCGDREEAALIVNEMVDLFVNLRGSREREEVTDKLARLSEQQTRLEGELAAAEKAIDDVRRRWGFGDLEERNFQNTVTIRLNDLEVEQNELMLQIQQVRAITENRLAQATGPINEQVKQEIEKDPIMSMLGQRLVLMETELAGALTRFGENHRVVRQIQEQMRSTEEEKEIRTIEIAEQTRKSNLQDSEDMLVVLEKRLEELERMRQEVTAKQKDLDLARVQYEQRVSIRDERKQRLAETKAQIEKLRVVHDDPETPKVLKIGDAPVPLEISSPRWEFYFPVGTIFGFMFGIGLVLLVELLNDLVRTPIDVSRYLHIRLLGLIPDAAEDDQVRGIDLCRAVHQAPYSIISESYRRFRTNLKLSASAEESSKVLLVTSGMAGEGKTSVAVNLATTFIAEDRKVLLVDANFRQPSLHKIFPKPQDQAAAVPPEKGSRKALRKRKAREIELPEFGLSTLLTGLCDYQEVIRPSGIEGLDVIDSGLLPSNPTELLGGAMMEQLLKHQRKSYDYVIVDGPPVLVVSDAKMLARLVDGTILVFNAGSTGRGAAQRTIREMKEVDAAIIGCVLFAVRAMKGGYFHEQFRSYLEYQKLQLAHSI